MPDSIDSLIQQAAQLSVEPETGNLTGGGSFVVNWLANANAIIAPWWSQNRDVQLRQFWKQIDYLSGTLYTMSSKMTAIPNKVVSRNVSIKKFAEQADYLTDVINTTPGKGKGWVAEYGKWVEDLLSQDNGAFMEVIGEGDPAGPIIGQPVSFAHLDSGRCTRTGNQKYPIVYEATNSKKYKLHFTRVMFASQMESPQVEMYGVGFCAVSRAIMIAQELLDILTFKQEKMGSRPHRKLLITQGGLDPSDLAGALARADSLMDAQGFKRYSKITIGGSSSLPEADVKEIELSNLPDGFNEENSIVYGMATIALAFGVDARELFPAMSAGATRADAMLQHLKERGKGPGQILQVTEQLFNHKFIPAHLKFVFDYQDDAEDRQVADIRNVRASARVQDTNTGAVSIRVMRENMMIDGDITRQQFERMELDDGRLPNGDPVISLFFQKGSDVAKMLDVGVSNPLAVDKNDPEAIAKKCAARKAEAMETLANAVSEQTRWNANVAVSALTQLEEMYKQVEMQEQLAQMPAKPAPNDVRTRRQDARNPTTTDRQGGDNRRDGKNSPDDRVEVAGPQTKKPPNRQP